MVWTFLAGLLPREGSLVESERVLGESALMPMAWDDLVSTLCYISWNALNHTLSLTKPSYLRVCLLVRLNGSRENWTPPDCLRLQRKEFWLPGAK